MSYSFDENYFINSMPNIQNNENLREPQFNSYVKAVEYYNGNYDNRNSLIVLPTGVGKTGVIALLPFGLCKKRALIITPGTAIKDTVLESLDPLNPDNFWYKAKVFENTLPLPNVIEYEGYDTPDEVLYASNIVILNIHKLQSRLDSSLINRVAKDFFDLIIIDEAHHSTASTWVECVNYFSEAKVVKLTGTPFRTDKEKINGNLIYKYPLSRAMYHSYVKSLSNLIFVPDKLMLAIDNDDTNLYTVDEIFKLGIKDKDWVTRSVAYSLECSKSIVHESILALNEKKLNSNIPHKIIAIACSIKHASQIEELYKKEGLRTCIVHSRMPKDDLSKSFKSIENNRVDVVINVAMLGEGYDHPYLSVAAIFRPFRNELPYTQFIGRVLRYIPNGKASDNIATIISHKHLYLDDLWNKYKKEINESKIIESLKNYDDIIEEAKGSTSNIDSSGKVIEIGLVKQSKTHIINTEDYLDTELLRRSKAEAAETQRKIKEIARIMNIPEGQASLIVKQANNSNNTLGRPDQLFKRKKKDIDSMIKETIVPSLIEKYNIDKDGIDIKNTKLFNKYSWIPNSIISKNSKGKNAGMLALYITFDLKNKIGLPRKQWKDSDYDIAFEYLPKLQNLIDSILKEYYNH
ncbi:restriction endonuclease subunit R [Clostridium perfringens]|uniref:DEAD/DEAH box helicase n=1 Tax=Clostridium perfringens TaxID=1502 RepID=UPI0030CC4442